MLDQGQKTATPAPPSGPERVGRYELVERIGDGAIAEVFLARRLGVLPFQRPIAVVKKIHAQLARNQQFIDLLLDEARVSALIKHPRVVDLYDVGVSRGVYFIASEHLSGQPLSTVLARSRAATARGTGSFLDVYSTARIVADVADGLHAAHELRSLTGRPIEMVHRDVTPRNVMVLYDGSVKLLDVGVARAWGAMPARDRTTGYLAPEQLDRGKVDRRTDIFSLGAVMWEALTGARLFDTASAAATLRQIRRGLRPPSAHRPEVPDAVDKICMRALAADPAERFQTASEMRSALESLLAETSFRRPAGGVAAFMAEVFTAERDAHQEQVERASEQAAQRPIAGERRPAPAVREAPEGEGADTLVRMPEELPGALMALGSQHIAMPEPTEPGARPVVPRPEPLPRERLAAARRASAALAAAARSAPLPAVPARGSGSAGPPLARSESPMDPGNGVPSGEPTVPGARSAGAATGTGVVVRGNDSEASNLSTGSSSRPRGKRRPGGRIDSIADAWTDRRQQASGRTLPLPAPPKVAVGTHSDASITSVGAEPEEDDDDFTFVDPDRSPRSFESGATSAVADRTGTSRAVLDDDIKPILTGHRSRRIWTAALVAVGATGLVSALVYTALGGGPRRPVGPVGQGAMLSPDAERPPFDTAPAAPSIESAKADEPAVAAAGKADDARKVDESKADESKADESKADGPVVADAREADESVADESVVAAAREAVADPEPAQPKSEPSAGAAAASTAQPSSSSSAPSTAQPSSSPAAPSTAQASSSPSAPSTAQASSSPAAPSTAQPSSSPSAPSTAQASSSASSPASIPSTSPAPPARTAPRGPIRPRIAAAPDATGDRADPSDEAARRTRPAPARKLTRPEPAPAANPDDLYRDGARLYLDGKLDEARRKFQTAIDSAPRFAPAHRGLGLVYERMGQKGRAIRSWQAYLRIAPGAADAELIRARIERLSR
jgi:hypothetical protein